jgi:hypothetical protein
MPELIESEAPTRRSGYRRLVALVAVAVAALVATLLVQRGDTAPTSQDGASRSTPHSAWASPLFLDPASWARDLHEAIETAQRRLCDPRYDYPGCTYSQQRSLEAGTKAEFKENYDKGRWGQGDNGTGSRAQWDNLNDDNAAHMRDLYRDAVDRFEAKHKREAAPFQTWFDFRSNMDCGGPFGAISGLVRAWCITQVPVNALADATKKITLMCDGKTIAAAVGTGVGSLPADLAKWAATTIKVGAMVAARAAVATAVACTVEYVWENLLPFGKLKTQAGAAA